MTGYEYHKQWFSWAYEHQIKLRPIHTALFLWIVETANQRGWVEYFRLPTDITMQTIGVRNYKTYIDAFEALEEYGFIKVGERSKNQYTANIIALVKNPKANHKALSNALSNASQKQELKHKPEHCECLKLVNLKTNKPINPKTLVLIETNVSTLEENLEKWLKGGFPTVKEKPKKNVELFKKMQIMFFEWYENDKKRKYSFQAKCGKAIYAIIKQIEAELRAGEMEVNDQSVIDSWRAILEGLPNIHKNDQWIYQGVELSLINSKWNQVVTGIKKQNNGTELTYENIMREANKIANANRSS